MSQGPDTGVEHNGRRTGPVGREGARGKRTILALVLVFMVLATYYNVTTPLFEASDEVYHYPYVHYVATQRRLPVQDPENIQLWRQEGSQPPLYYLIAATATGWIDTSDFSERLVPNPHAKIGLPQAQDNKNLVVHTPDEGFPYRGTALAVHLIRFLSTLMGAGTVALTFLIVREIAPEREHLALLAAAVTAFNPMFVFITASVNNDNLTILLCTLILWQTLRVLRYGATPGRAAAIGCAVGLACLTKMSAIGMVVPVALAITWDAWQRRASFRSWLRNAVLAAAPVMAIAGWWYVRNWVLYGDPLGFNAWLAIAGTREQAPTVASLLAEFEGFRISYWGLFGGVNVLMDPRLYKLYDALVVLALIGLASGGVRWFVHRRKSNWGAVLAENRVPIAQGAILAVWPLILLGALIRWTSLTPASQGRLVFPAIAAMSFWLSLGWDHVVPESWRRASRPAIAVPLLAIAVVAPLAFIRPAYTPPARASGLPESLAPVNVWYGDQIELAGYHLVRREVLPGDTLAVELGWRALVAIKENYSIFVHLYGRDGEFLGQADTYPGGGLLPTGQWLAGDEYVDRVYVPVAPEAQVPAMARIVVGLYSFEDKSMLPASDPRGAALGSSPTIGRFKIAATQPVRPGIPHAADYQLGSGLELIGYDLPAAPGEITLFWRAVEPVGEDYTVFVHLLDDEGRTVAQADGQPQDGEYPTSWWGTGEVIADRHTVPREQIEALSPGRYTIRVGMYNLAGGARLPVTLEGQPQGDHILLGPVVVP